MTCRRTFLLLAVLATLRFSAGVIQCYTCVSANGQDLTCVDDPTAVTNGSPVTDCDMGERECCTIIRMEYVEQPGKIMSFARSCQKNCPKMGVSEIVDSSYHTWLTYCNTPKCNTGPGNGKLGGDGSGGGGDNIIGPIAGIEDGASAATASLGLLASGLLLAFLRA